MARAQAERSKNEASCEIVDYSQTVFKPNANQPPAGVRTYMLALEISDTTNRGRFRFRLADDLLDPISGLWAVDPWTVEQQRDLPVWHADILAGEAYCLHAEPGGGSFYLATRCEIETSVNAHGYTKADVLRPYDAEMAQLEEYVCTWRNEEMRVNRPGVRYDYDAMPGDSRDWRLCADKNARCWRVRDEANNGANGLPNGNLWEVQDYRGLINLTRLRINETHIFHTGFTHVDDIGVLHFSKKPAS